MTKISQFPISEEMEALLNAYQPVIVRRGAMIQGTVVGKCREGLLIDTRSKCESILPHDEAGDLEIGDSRLFYVVSDSEELGGVLSLNKAQSWSRAIDAQKDNATEEVIVRVLKRRRDSDHIFGAIVELRGVRGFMHVSEMTIRGQQLRELKDKTVAVKVLEADPNSNNLIVSQKAAAAEAQTRFFETAKVGDIVRGTVSSFGTNKERQTEYGAFIDLGGVFGLLHRSEINSNRNAIPSKTLSLGQELELVITAIERESKKISLSLKQVSLQRFLSTVSEGQVLEAPVARKADFGVFFTLADGIDGLLFNWDMGPQTAPSKLNKGDVVRLKIKSIEGDKISLTTKQLPEA